MTATEPPRVHRLSVDELVTLLRSPDVVEDLSLAHGCAAVVVTGADWPREELTVAQRNLLEWLPCVTVAPSATPAWRDFDVAAEAAAGSSPDGGLDTVLDAVLARPQAAVALVRLLRAARRSDPLTALWAESVTYGLLQGGPEFADWCRRRAPRVSGGDRPGQVQVERRGPEVTVVLDRPERHNAIDLGLRDALVDALRAAAADPAVDSVVLRGEGPSFCSGGDLAEFATFPDPVAAHLVRSTRLPAREVLHLRHRLTARVHGACVGAGAELVAFAATVVADPGTTFRLPEVGMGLVPGSGGTWSITRRIGRQRAAWLALSGEPIDAATAMAWGLVDRIEPGAHG